MLSEGIYVGRANYHVIRYLYKDMSIINSRFFITRLAARRYAEFLISKSDVSVHGIYILLCKL